MVNMHTKFEVSSLSRSRDIFRKLMGHVTWPRPFQGRFVICRLGLAMLIPHTKFEVSAITCNEEMKGNAKILALSHHLGNLGAELAKKV